MSTAELEQRLAAVEKTVAELRATIAAQSGVTPQAKWWEAIGHSMDGDDLKAFEDAQAYGRYFRRTGKDAPPDWRPGDPIPEPEPGT